VNRDLSWQLLGLCRQVDPELFFPEQGQPPTDAKRVCWRCEVRVTCLEWALATREPFGIWGGKTASERRDMLRRQRMAS